MSVEAGDIEKRLAQYAVGVPVVYLAASCVAYGVDFCLTVGLSSAGAPAPLAASVGYLIGMGVHWILSARFVFTDAVALSTSALRRQQALFFLTGIVGLGVTVATYTLLCDIHIAPAVAKLLAAVGSFATTYLCRRHFVFRGENVV